MQRLRALLTAQKGDLSLFALLQVPLLGLNVLVAKALAARHAYPDSPAGPFLGLLVRVLSWDVLLLGIVAALALVSRSVPLPARARGPLLALLYAAFAFLTLFHFVNAGFFMFFGAPLTRDLLLLASPMVGYVTKVVTPDEPMLRLSALALVAPLLLTPIAWHLRPRLVRADGRRWTAAAWALGGVLLLAGIALAWTPVARYREIALRRLSVLAFLAPARGSLQRPDDDVTAEHRRTLDGLLQGPRADGKAALAALPRRKRNVVIWVWESVGERFLRAHHPFGEAEAPELERLKRRGSVRFTQAWVECPLSAQSDWTLMTGISPPANPRVFRSEAPLPRHVEFLPAVFKAAGYRTAFLSSSYLQSWGETRFLEQASLDLLEDGLTLENRHGYKYQTWSIEGRAIVARFFDWRDKVAADGAPFFALLWNVETHHNYSWIGMPPELAAAPALQRYMAAINYTDKLLGEFYRQLEARGLAEDTLVVVVGDHGQAFGRGDHPHDRFHSLLVNEDVLQVPLVFLHPALASPARVDTVVTLADVYPTVLDLSGIAAPAGIDGRSMASDYQPRVLVHRTITWWPMAARAGRFKLVQDRRDDPPELYDVVADPWETTDISSRHPAVTEALWAYLRRTTADRIAQDPSFAMFSQRDWLLF